MISHDVQVRKRKPWWFGSFARKPQRNQSAMDELAERMREYRGEVTEIEAVK